MLLTIKLQKHENGSVLAFKNGKCCANWPSYKSKKPDFRNRYVMMNCYRYKIEWDKTIATGVHEITN
jgi:hypothetical protein